MGRGELCCHIIDQFFGNLRLFDKCIKVKEPSLKNSINNLRTVPSGLGGYRLNMT